MRQCKQKRKETSPSFCEYIKKRARSKREMGKHGTAELYEVAGRHFERFLGGKPCRIVEVTATLIADFHGYLQKQRLKTNSINSYMSCVRASYNAARSEGMATNGENPFARLRLRREMTTKRAIPADTMRQIARMDLREEPEMEMAADLAIFSFIAQGMPFVDIVNLGKKNIQGKEIVYNRHKTGTQIRIGITEALEALIQKHRNDTPYVFPLGQESAEEEGYRGYKLMLARQNRALGEIGKRLGMEAKLTTYVMRHTWASEALANHVPMSVISQAMGHSSEKTTKFYLNTLDQSELNEANKRITGFLDIIMTENGKGTYLRNKVTSEDATYLRNKFVSS